MALPLVWGEEGKIVIDRFHVQKLVNKALNKIRLALNLKGLRNRCLLMNNQINLTTEEKEETDIAHLRFNCRGLLWQNSL
ncbi:transposase [Chamaesiphon sp. VAR_48_metabat_403]|uniref:transposase n=1 Tax=Chamaesiphon sp. VAR_48_metabat_403 TaxID=2964700 RepID=UPI00286DE5E9|nr:transposase [Chamaesiphon sp. VAR_48_metabat_403]